jgi:hypothetical protein
MPNLYYLIRSFNDNTRSDYSSTNANEIISSVVTENKAALYGAFAMKNARCAVRLISNQTELNSKQIPVSAVHAATSPRVCEYDTPLAYLIVYFGAV